MDMANHGPLEAPCFCFAQHDVALCMACMCGSCAKLVGSHDVLSQSMTACRLILIAHCFQAGAEACHDSADTNIMLLQVLHPRIEEAHMAKRLLEQAQVP